MEPAATSSGDGVVLRPATPADAEIVGTYHHQCWLLGYRGLLPDDLLDALQVEDRIASTRLRLEDASVPPTMVVTVDGSDRPVGHTWGDDDTIHNVYVDPNFWRRGLGRVLVREGERLLAERGVHDGFLWTIVGNERAVALYESEGWALDGLVEEHEHPLGFSLEEMRMHKVLPLA